MALTIHLNVVSAEALIYSGPIEKVVVPAVMGELCVLARHAPLLTHLRPGLVRVVERFEKEESFFVSSGFLEVQPHIVTVLADTVLRTRDIDEAAARAAKERAEQALASRVSQTEYARLKTELELETALLRAIDQLRRRGNR